jgi:glutamate dehydrogenase
MSSHDATQAVMDRVADMIRERLPEPQAQRVDAFVRQYYARVEPQDLEHRDAVDVYGAALSHWSLALKPPAGRAQVRVYNPRFDEHGWESTHTVVETHVDDMPFLVDSVGMELLRHGLDIHLVIHPVIRLRRDADGNVLDVVAPGSSHGPEGEGAGVRAESFIHVEVDRQGDPEVVAEIERDLARALADVRAAVEDWPRMLTAVERVIAELQEHPPPVPQPELEEAKAFLAWLADDHFTFLGFREYELVTVDGEDELRGVPDTGLGILRGPAPRSTSFAKVPPEVRRLAREQNLLNITKANSIATVHRPTRLDYVGVKRFDGSGEPFGEWRFLGLSTSTLYSTSVTQIPLLRRKVAAVMDRARFEAASHDAKDLLTILENYPRDELLQIGEDELYHTAMGILGLQERQQLRVFIRRERFGRYFSCLVFLPRDRFNTDNRVAIQRILMDALGGVSIEYQSRLSESVLARIHFIVRIEPGDAVDYDAAAIERRLAQAIRSWTDELADALVEEFGEHRGVELFHRYREAFPAGYRADFPARMGAVDIRRIEDALDRDLALHAHHPLEAPPERLRLKLFHSGQPITISDALPLFENMGVTVVDERPYEIRPEGAEPVWIYDFGLSTAQVSDEQLAEPLRVLAQEAFARVWRGEAENDGFNRLVLAGGLPWRDVIVLRAYSKYLRQTGQTFSQDYMERTLAAHPHIARLLLELFRARFDPAEPPAGQDRASADELTQQLLGAIDVVASLDQDRILRSFLGLVLATLRTNAFQVGDDGEPKAHLAFKLDPALVDDLPSPRPMFEIFVYSPRTEGVHLRGGKVARGGLRWSDRREDFRREVLGLMTAQMVKNSVIVPVGAKGGFVVKRPPADPAALADEAVACYRTFVRGLLDLTDNLVGGEVVVPPRVVRHDGDDPYLVVAADKGTAAFSDIANEISAEYRFWLGDAFASGGSSGYDHKRMGITARGAFESVKRHFRQLGINVETTEITAVGIGDMSGDVFGNGMTLFPHLKLVGAFDHRHIFLDPDPDPEAAERQRERLFRLPGSTWADYDEAAPSAGGGVYPRTAKAVPLSPEARELLGIDAESATPNEVIRALLCAPVDLLWNGAIGTFVKASTESHIAVGDKVNDAVRIDARELRCRVVAEGGNLGFTQEARIEFTRAGGLVNSDFIDNSAGVDCSDREVNIKILLDGEVADGDLTRKQRDALLGEMTDEVAALVLRDNYLQAQALARTVVSTRERGRYLGFLRSVEQAGRVDRGLDPGAEYTATSSQSSAAGERLTVPELALLFAHTKIMVYDALLDSDVPEDPFMARELARYFPTPLRERFARRMQMHPLRREIIANAVANEVVNRLDFTATFTVADWMDTTLAEVARAFTVVREILGLRRLWAEIEALDDRVAAAVQTEMVGDIGRVLTSLMRWLLRHRGPPIDVEAEVIRFRDQVTTLAPVLRTLLAPREREQCELRAAQFVGEGVPAGLADEVAWLGAVMPAPDVVEVAEAAGEPAEVVAAVQAGLCDRLRLDWLRERMDELAFATRWETLSRLGVRDELFDHRRALTATVLRSVPPGPHPGARIDAWLAANPVAAARFERLTAEIEQSGTFDVATLTVALSELRNLVPHDPLG